VLALVLFRRRLLDAMHLRRHKRIHFPNRRRALAPTTETGR
jgi:hypothetical protein